MDNSLLVVFTHGLGVLPIDRSIKTAEIALCKIRDIIKENNKHLLKRNKQLFINYVFHDKDMENSTELFNL